MTTIYQKYWYYCLDEKKRGLFSQISRGDCHMKLIIRLAFAENGKETKYYTAFKNFIEFRQYMSKISMLADAGISTSK